MAADKKALIPVEINNILLHEEEAQRIIRKYTLIAAGGGIFSNFAVSISATTGVQVLMIKELCQLYQVSFDQRMAGVVINSAIGSVVSSGLSFALSSLLPASSPNKGLDLSGAGVASVYTATVGEFYKVHFQKGGNLESVSIMDLGDYFVDEVQKGDIKMRSFSSPFSVIRSIFNF